MLKKISRRKNHDGTDYELCAAGTDRRGDCPVLLWYGSETDADNQGQVYSADSRCFWHRPLWDLGSGNVSTGERSGDCNGYIYGNRSGNFNGGPQYLCESNY